MPDTIDQDDDIHRRLQEANVALSKNKDSPLSALRTKAIALIKLDRDADALKLFDDFPKLREAAGASARAAGAGAGATGDRQLQCAYAYALYKGGRFEDVWRTFGAGDGGEIKGAKGVGSRGLRHVLAQTAYRAEDYKTAEALYQSLARGTAVVANEGHDLSVNQKAVHAQLGWAIERVGVSVEADSGVEGEFNGFEEAFNVACRYLAVGDLDCTETMLDRARDMCENGDLTGDEYKEEMCYISSQGVYLAYLRKISDTKFMSSFAAPTLLKDPVSLRVALNNLLLIPRYNKNPYRLQRAFSMRESLAPHAHFSSIQRRLVQRNELALSLSLRKYNSLKRGQFSRSGSSMLEEPSKSVFKRAADCHCYDNKAVKKQLLKQLRKRPDDVGVLLLLLHMHVRSKKRKAALSQLNEFLKNTRSFPPATMEKVTPYLPGLMSIWLALVSPRLGRRAGSKVGGCTFGENGVLTKTGTFLNQTFNAVTIPSPLSRVTGAALLVSGKFKDFDKAQELLSSLTTDGRGRNTNNNITADSDEGDGLGMDPVVNAGIIAARAQRATISKTPSSEPTHGHLSASEANLTPIPKIIKSINAAELEKQGGRFQLASQPISSTSSSHPSRRNRQNNQSKKSIEVAQNSSTFTTNETTQKLKPKSEAGKEKSKRTPRKRHLIASRQAGSDTASTSASGPPDPERWLPVRDRSSYKPPRSKAGKGGGGKAKGKGAGRAGGGGGGGGTGKGRDAGGVTQGGL